MRVDVEHQAARFTVSIHGDTLLVRISGRFTLGSNRFGRQFLQARPEAAQIARVLLDLRGAQIELSPNEWQDSAVEATVEKPLGLLVTAADHGAVWNHCQRMAETGLKRCVFTSAPSAYAWARLPLRPVLAAV